MPEVSDAIDVITDPSNIVGSDSHSDERRVNAKKALKALKVRGASKGDARLLITAAVEELGGHTDSEIQSGARATGPDSRKAEPVWFIPAAKVRKPDAKP
jgi:hypothetical protein